MLSFPHPPTNRPPPKMRLAATHAAPPARPMPPLPPVRAARTAPRRTTCRLPRSTGGDGAAPAGEAGTARPPPPHEGELRAAQAADEGGVYPVEETRVRDVTEEGREEKGGCMPSPTRTPPRPPRFSSPPPVRLLQRLVDTAMLAAVGGLVYALGSVLRLQAYMR